MATFEKFRNSFNPDSHIKGKQFEHFVKWFLENDLEWSTQVDQVWLWDDYPDRWGPDCGVDLVFNHKNGDVWAVQAKCYSPENTITEFPEQYGQPVESFRVLSLYYCFVVMLLRT